MPLGFADGLGGDQDIDAIVTPGNVNAEPFDRERRAQEQITSRLPAIACSPSIRHRADSWDSRGIECADDVHQQFAQHRVRSSNPPDAFPVYRHPVAPSARGILLREPKTISDTEERELDRTAYRRSSELGKAALSFIEGSCA
jgi:hypothetical protein